MNKKMNTQKTSQLDIPKIIRAAAKYGVKKLKIGEVEIEFEVVSTEQIQETPTISKTWTPKADEIAIESEENHDLQLEEERLAQLDLFDPCGYEEHMLKDGTNED